MLRKQSKHIGCCQAQTKSFRRNFFCRFFNLAALKRLHIQLRLMGKWCACIETPMTSMKNRCVSIASQRLLIQLEPLEGNRCIVTTTTTLNQRTNVSGYVVVGNSSISNCVSQIIPGMIGVTLDMTPYNVDKGDLFQP